ncbi:MAG: SGNH/GDSL hydrolase family protein [Silvibacterium sp.]
MIRVIVCAAALLYSGHLGAQTATPAAGQPSAPTATTSPIQPNAEQVQRMQAQLADWADLDRYRADNAALPPPTAGEPRVVFMGDSITDGWGRWEGRGPFFPGKPYINRGISGQTTPQMLVRFQQDVVHLHPAVVVILAGTNDIAGNTGPSTPEMIEDNFTSMADIAKQNGIKVVIASITPAYDYPWRPGIQPVAEIRALNQWLREFCSSNGFVYLDYYDSMADAKGAMLPGYSIDGVHPTAKGYAVMAPLAEQAIAQALAK